MIRKYIGPYKVMEVFDNHTYKLERNGKVSCEHEDRLKPFHQARNSWGKAAGEGETSRQPTRAGYQVQREERPTPLELFLRKESGSSNISTGDSTEKASENTDSQKEEVVLPPTTSEVVSSPLVPEEDRNKEGVVSPQPTSEYTRSGRAVRKPKHLQDFVAQKIEPRLDENVHMRGSQPAVYINSLQLSGKVIPNLSWQKTATTSYTGLPSSSSDYTTADSYLDYSTHLDYFTHLDIHSTSLDYYATLSEMSEEVLNIHEEGELSSGSSSEEERAKESVKTEVTTKKYPYIEQRTFDSIRGVTKFIKKERESAVSARKT